MSKKMHKTGTLSVFGFAHNFTSKTPGAFLKLANRPVRAACQLARDVTVHGRFRHTPRGYWISMLAKNCEETAVSKCDNNSWKCFSLSLSLCTTLGSVLITMPWTPVNDRLVAIGMMRAGMSYSHVARQYGVDRHKLESLLSISIEWNLFVAVKAFHWNKVSPVCVPKVLSVIRKCPR